MDYFEELVQELVLGKVTSRDELLRLKAKLCKKHRLARVPANHEALARVPEEYREVVEPFLKNKPMRTMSGVAPIAVMTSPFDCPHGRCSYCPGGTSVNTPQSYTGQEPAALRGAMYDYDPFKQTSSRMRQLQCIGHHTNKVDLIVMGGTFTSRPPEYQRSFVKRCFDAMNEEESSDIDEAHRRNETAKSRCVGLTVETRPDWFAKPQMELALSLGATKVEFGVQILDDTVLDGVKRGHHVKEVAVATRLAKDAGLKVAYHIMPGLPGSSPERDLESFRTMIEDERFKPDMLKIYPTLVVKGTELHKMWVEGRYSPMSLEATIGLLAEIKKMTPPWIRILRIQRDIPVKLIEAGAKKSHLRQLVMQKLKDEGTPCRCIRCREVGRRTGVKDSKPSEAELVTVEYATSGGKEMFVSYEAPSCDSLVGYARLRLPSMDAKAALLRELHIYGQMMPFSERSSTGWQHLGFGEKLLEECESRSMAAGYQRLRVTSGVGARAYYRRFGYEHDGAYMSKPLGHA